MRSLMTLATLSLLFVFAGCSTTASFKIPEGTNLIVRDIPVSSTELLEYKRTPFFWDVTPGIPYRLEKDGQVVREGKLKSHFRVASIFWPPFALIYWSMRFDGPYDLTVPNSKVKPGTEISEPTAKAEPVKVEEVKKEKKRKK
jgi:hypothetical protein